MFVIIFALGSSGKGHDKTINTAVGQHFHVDYFFVKGFIRETNDYIVTLLISELLNPPDDRGKKMMDNIRDDNSNILGPFVLQANRNIVGLVIVETGEGLDLLFGITTDLFAIL